MNSISFVFALLASASVFPDYHEAVNQDSAVEMNLLKPDILAPTNELHVEAFGIADDIRKEIEKALEDLDDPYKIQDNTEVLDINEQVSVIISYVNINLEGHSGLIIDTLRVRLLVPLYPRIIFKFLIPKLTFTVDLLSATIKSEDSELNSNINGQLSIINSSIEGRMTVGAITKRLTDVTIDLRIGTIQSTLVGKVGRVDITGILTDIFTDIIPQILHRSANQINKAIEDVIMRLYKEL